MEGRLKVTFVFGSNLAGRHGAGSAKHARDYCGAKYGVGVGPTGQAYAIPTKDERLKTLPIDTIRQHVDDFIAYANDRPGEMFCVVKIGCGLAGYTEDEIAPLFLLAPPNCILPDGWRDIAMRHTAYGLQYGDVA